MKRLKAIIFFSLMCSVFSLFSEELAEKMHEPTQPQNIRILLKKDASEALLEVKGGYYIHNPYDGSRISSGMFGKRFLVRASKDGLKWGESFPGIHQIAIVPKSNDTSILLDGIQYDGIIAVYKVGKKLHIVNEVSVESFLKATLSSQFTYPYEMEVMSAIAIAARTTAYFHVNKNPETFWHVGKDEYQYYGSALVIPDSSIVKAIDATRDMIMVSSINGKKLPFAAIWTEHSGGKTAAFHNIFRKDLLAPKQGVEIPHAAIDRNDTKWSYSMSKQSFADLFGIKSLFSIDLFSEQFANKIYAVRIKDENTSHDLSFFKFQKKLGKEYIKSNDFTVSINNNDITFSGYGKGHGVGLCLFSATSMAQNGEIAVKILSKFYPDTYLVNLSAIPSLK